ncbi:hypothetical protein KQX54_013593 [Cotesia glomerata]|uniref:Reverse transcriptase zinc-binding domain-containing protein n=1 Tax=Cotesia glomerata TaxID=32391 RepID=A0AAV7HTT1_COTGL|nr:hypothetical protein KQX54_013593 [Cotesia glomerata]
MKKCMRSYEADDSYLPQICIKRLDELVNSPACQEDLNWVTKFKNFLKKMNAEDLWPVTDHCLWKSKKLEVFNRYKDSLRERDIAKYCNSTSCLFRIYKPLTMVLGEHDYLYKNHPMLIKRTIAQIRLANKYQAYLSIIKSNKINPTKICLNCTLNENIEHILFVCPAYEDIRNNLYGGTYEPEHTSLNFYLANLSHYDTRKLCKLATQVLDRRDKM